MSTLTPVRKALGLRRPTQPARVDAGIAAAFVVLSALEIVTNESVRSPAQHILLAALPLVALAWRRQFPIAVAFTIVVSNFLINQNGEFTTLLSLVLCCFTVGSETLPPRSYVGLGVVLTPFLAGIAATDGVVPSDVGAAIVFIVGPWAVGAATQQRAATAEEAVLRAELRVQEQERQVQEAAAAERNRIARELHDIVSHSISVVTIQTQAVRRRLGPDHATEAADLAMVEATAREALAEMRRLFGVLRTDGESAALAPQPGLSELPRLVDSVGTAGPRIRLEVEGVASPLPPGVDLAAFRIAQEGLTNALRHAGATEVVITVRHRPGAVEVDVADDGHGLHPNGGSGHGLVGVRERVALYDGTVELQQLPSGGVRLSACLPVAEVTP